MREFKALFEKSITKNNIIIREPTLEDSDAFVATMLRSQLLHYPWVKSPQTLPEFRDCFQRFQQPNQKII